MSLALLESRDEEGRQYLEAGLVFYVRPDSSTSGSCLILRDLKFIVKAGFCSVFVQSVFGIVPCPRKEIRRV